METVPLWCIIFINCMTLLGSIWILFASIQKQGQTYAFGVLNLCFVRAKAPLCES